MCQRARPPPLSSEALRLGQLVREVGDPALQEGFTRIQVISVVHQRYCFNLTSYSTERDPDIVTYLQIASTFEFKA